MNLIFSGVVDSERSSLIVKAVNPDALTILKLISNSEEPGTQILTRFHIKWIRELGYTITLKHKIGNRTYIEPYTL